MYIIYQEKNTIIFAQGQNCLYLITGAAETAVMLCKMYICCCSEDMYLDIKLVHAQINCQLPIRLDW